MIGVLILALEVIRSYLKRGIPRVKFTPPWPAKWKVFNVIWVEGYPMDWAPVHPTHSPGCTMLWTNFKAYTSLNYFSFLFLASSKHFSDIDPRLVAGGNFYMMVSYTLSLFLDFALNYSIYFNLKELLFYSCLYLALKVSKFFSKNSSLEKNFCLHGSNES